MKTKIAVPIPVARALRKLGKDIADGRKRRRIPVKLMAERAGVSPRTLAKIEQGDGGVAVSSYVSLIFALGMIDRIEDLVDARHDIVGLELEEEQLPKRIHLPRRKAKGEPHE